MLKLGDDIDIYTLLQNDEDEFSFFLDQLASFLEKVI